MAEGGVFIGRVFNFWIAETDLFPHYRKPFCMSASGVNDRALIRDVTGISADNLPSGHVIKSKYLKNYSIFTIL